MNLKGAKYVWNEPTLSQAMHALVFNGSVDLMGHLLWTQQFHFHCAFMSLLIVSAHPFSLCPSISERASKHAMLAKWNEPKTKRFSGLSSKHVVNSYEIWQHSQELNVPQISNENIYQFCQCVSGDNEAWPPQQMTKQLCFCPIGCCILTRDFNVEPSLACQQCSCYKIRYMDAAFEVC